MSGFFKRLRGDKKEEEGAADTAAPSETGSKKGKAGESPPSAPPTTSAPTAPAPASEEMVKVPPLPPTGTRPAKESPGPKEPPPPLPQADPAAPSASQLVTAARPTDCFLCGSPLADGYCATCKMAWKE